MATAVSLLILLIINIICGFFGGAITRHKKEGYAAGFCLGLFFGPIGLVIAASIGLA